MTPYLVGLNLAGRRVVVIGPVVALRAVSGKDLRATGK